MASVMFISSIFKRRERKRRVPASPAWARRSALLGGMAVILAATVVPSSTAQERLRIIGEGTTACPRGYLCAWPDTNFRGRGVAVFGTESDWRIFPPPYDIIDNRASSFFNNGVTEDEPDVRLGRESSLNLGTFVICNGDSIPDLGRGRNDGAIPGRGWNDEVSSNEWFSSFWC